MSWHWPREKGQLELEGMGVWRCGSEDIASWATCISEVGNGADSVDADGGVESEAVEKNCTWRRTS